MQHSEWAEIVQEDASALRGETSDLSPSRSAKVRSLRSISRAGDALGPLVEVMSTPSPPRHRVASHTTLSEQDDIHQSHTGNCRREVRRNEDSLR
jgi:hypothetical protein